MQGEGGNKNDKIWKGKFEDIWNSQRKKEIKDALNSKRINEINKIIGMYNKNEKTIDLLCGFNDIDDFFDDEKERKLYNETKKYI